MRAVTVQDAEGLEKGMESWTRGFAITERQEASRTMAVLLLIWLPTRRQQYFSLTLCPLNKERHYYVRGYVALSTLHWRRARAKN